MSGLPKSVQRQLDEANALQAQAAPAAPEAAPAAPPAQPVEAPPVAPAPAAPQSEDWQQKYRSLQGLFNARTREFESKVQDMSAQLAEAQRQLTEATAAMKAQKETPKKPHAPDPRDVEQFGGDLVEMVRKYAAQHFDAVSESLGAMAQRLDQRVSALEQAVNGTSEKVARTQEEQFYVILDQAVPDWRAVNESERFLDWLAVEDPVYGVSRQTVLSHAHSRLDAKRVVAIFNQFKSEQKAAPSLESQVAPRTTAASAPAVSTPTAKKTYTQRFIDDFYRDVNRGRYSAEQAAAIEADIYTAARENRIVG